MEKRPPLPVLLVEDNEIDIEITRRVIARSPVPVELTVARDGAEALALLFGERPAALPRLVLLDLRLPLFDGREVLRRIKNHPDLSPVPVAVLTGAADERPLQECLSLGSNMYFVKPISVADVITVVTTVHRYWDLVEALQRRKGPREET